MLILDRSSEGKLEELVKVTIELNTVLRENGMLARRGTPDRATLLWHAMEEEIARRKDKINKICSIGKGAEQEVLRHACLELKKEYDRYNELMEELYGEELLPATIPELLISSVKRATIEMQESNRTLLGIKGAMKSHV